MEAVGQLTGGIAHDFNNLLTVLFGDLDMLEARITDRRGLSLVREARETAELGAELTARLLAFGRRQPLRSEEHTSELQSLMRISYAVFCLKKTKTNTT